MKPTDSAFPELEAHISGVTGHAHYRHLKGMDLRTYLAGQAMQGLYAGAMSSVDIYCGVEKGAQDAGYSNPATYLAYQAVLAADALIVELNKEQK